MRFWHKQPKTTPKKSSQSQQRDVFFLSAACSRIAEGLIINDWVKMLRFHRGAGLVANAAFSGADRRERRPRTNSWVAGVVNALQALALGVQAAPLVSGLLGFGAAAACRTEAVAAVPSQHRTGLSQNSWKDGQRGERLFR